MSDNEKTIFDDLREEAVFLAVLNYEDINKTKAGKKAKKILEDSDEIFGEFKEELEYLNETSPSTLRDSIPNKMIKEEKLKYTREPQKENEGMRSHILDIDIPLDKIKLKHRKWLVAPGEKEKKKYFLDIREKARDALNYLDTDHYVDFRNELINFIEYRDLYSLTYQCKPLVEYLEKCFISFESTEDKYIDAAKPELKLYLEVWEEALKKKYDKLLEDTNKTDILINALDLLYDEFTYSAEILEEEMTEEIEIIESIAKLAEEIGLYEDEKKEKFELLLDKIENHEV